MPLVQTMSEVVKLNIKPTEINPIVDACSDTTYVFVLRGGDDSELNVSDYAAAMQLRPYSGSKKVYDELTTENGRLVVEGGRITIKFPASVTANYKFDAAVYDLYIVSVDGMQYRVAQGGVQVSREVTLL